MKTYQNLNLLEKTTELLASNESTHKQHKYLPNYKLINIQKLSNNNNESKSQINDSILYDDELNYYKEITTKMNSDIGDINNKLLSIDNSLSSSLISGNIDSMRSNYYSIQEITPNTDKSENVFNSQKNNFKKEKEQKTPKSFSRSQLELEEKEKNTLELEMNSKALLEKNKELEKQLDNIINEPIHTQEASETITEPNQKEIHSTGAYKSKTIKTTENDNQNNMSEKLMDTTSNYSNIQEDRKQERITQKKNNYQKQKRSNSTRNKLLKNPVNNERLIKGKELHKVKIDKLSNILHQENSLIAFAPGKEQYYKNERKQFIETLNYLESSFNNQIHALNQKYQKTIEKQKSKIERLFRENKTLKLKINQIKTIMK